MVQKKNLTNNLVCFNDVLKVLLIGPVHCPLALQADLTGLFGQEEGQETLRSRSSPQTRVLPHTQSKTFGNSTS